MQEFFLKSFYKIKTLPLGSSMVGDEGLEPPTSSLSVTRSNQLSYSPIFDQLAKERFRKYSKTFFGGDTGTRTLDPLLAKQVL